MADNTVHVEGLKQLERAFKLADKEEAKLLRKELKLAAEPVKRAAEGKALSRIGKMPLSPQWAVMRLGMSRSVVYMVPKQKGTHGRGRHRRPNLKNLLLDLAMEPALAEQAAEVERRVQNILETVGRKWEQA